jgi:hypothetical protein
MDYLIKNYSNYTVDIQDLYKKWIAPLDQFRVDAFINGNVSYDSFQNIEHKTVIPPQPTHTNTYNPDTYFYFKESRCHAFYRSLGLPVTDGTDFFNPGYDDNKESLLKKINISNNFIKTNSAQTSKARFDYLSGMQDIFKSPGINNSVMTLSSKNVRKFSECVKTASEKNPTEITLKDCTYEFSTVDSSGNDMFLYTDESNKTPDFKKQRSHIILPIIVDPRYAFCSGVNTVNIPFFTLKNDSKIQYISAGIEQICIYRLQDTAPTLTSSQKQIIDSIKKYSSSKDVSSQVLNNVYTSLSKDNKSASVYYAIFYGLMKAMMKELKNNVQLVNASQTLYHFLPNPGVSGPEFATQYGSIVKTIYFNDKYNTAKDEEIVKASLEYYLFQIDTLSQNILSDYKQKEIPNDAPNPLKDAFAFFSKEKQESETKIKNLKKLNDERSATCKKAIEALQNIEYITGEFSGFGLCDYWVIFSSLHLISVESLVSLLDDTSYENMKSAPFNIKSPPARKPIGDALKELSKTIYNLYNVCDSLYNLTQ